MAVKSTAASRGEAGLVAHETISLPLPGEREEGQLPLNRFPIARSPKRNFVPQMDFAHSLWRRDQAPIGHQQQINTRACLKRRSVPRLRSHRFHELVVSEMGSSH